MARERVTLDVDDLVRRYDAGTSVKKIAEELSVSRGVVCSRLQARGIKPRSRSEAETLKWAQRRERADFEDVVRRQCEGAWAGARGRVAKPEEVMARARTTYLKGSKRQRDENRLADLLALSGLDVEQQFAVGRYNLDLSVSTRRVAIEIVSSPLKQSYAMTLPKRVKYLLDAGWFVLFVELMRGKDRKPIVWTAVAKKVLSFFEEPGRAESFYGHYAVIGREGQPSSALSKYLPNVPRIEHP